MESSSRVERVERVVVGCLMFNAEAQGRRDAERSEPRNTQNTRNAKTTQGLRPTRLRRRDERMN